MKFTIAIAAVFFAAASNAQDPSELPECALPCFIDNVDVTDCTGVEDYACLCAYALSISGPLTTMIWLNPPADMNFCTGPTSTTLP